MMHAAATRSLRAVARPSRHRLLTTNATAGHSLKELLTRSSPLVAHTSHEMEQIGAQLAKNRSAGDVIFLKGDLGCGKTCFARGFVRELTDDAALQVTSPTYLLVNTYEQPASSEIYHVDLYRLDSVSKQDMAALGLAEAFSKGHGAMSCISLVEWPERLDAESVPTERLDVLIEYDDTDESLRHVSFHPYGERWTQIASSQ